MFKALDRRSASLKRAVSVDQSPIGRTPRSVPVTFLGIWDEIRSHLFAWQRPTPRCAAFRAVALFVQHTGREVVSVRPAKARAPSPMK